MESGVISEENLSGILRAISQRRRNGTLEITYPDHTLSVLFMKGRVVEVLDSRSAPWLEVFQLFAGAGWVEADDNLQIGSYGELFRQLNERAPQRAISEQFFRFVIQHRILDRLYALDFRAGAYYTFRVQMVEFDRDFAPSISPGQLLLDFVSLKSDNEKFESTFTSDSYLTLGTEVPAGLTDEEQSIVRAIGRDGLAFSNVAPRSMVSRFHLQEALLAMKEKGIVISSAGVKTPSVEAPAKTDARQIRASAQTEQRKSAAPLQPDSLAELLDSSLDQVIAAAEAELDSDLDSEPEPAGVAEPQSLSEELTLFNDESSALPEKSAPEESLQPGPASSGPFDLLVTSNRLLQNKAIPDLVVGVILLAALAGPALRWILAIQLF